MSGEFVSGFTKALDINKDNFRKALRGSNYQVSSVYFHKVINLKGSEKSLTKAAIARHENRAQDYQSLLNLPKYYFGAVRLGVTTFKKVKADFAPTNNEIPRKKGVKRGRFIAAGSLYSTLTQAKKASADLYTRTGTLSDVSLALVDSADPTRLVGKVKLFTAIPQVIGEMKSLPKTQRKGYRVIPEYLYYVEAVLPDAENEWM